MAAGRIVILPNYMPVRDLNGDPVAGARLYFYENKTTDLATVFTSAALDIPHTNPVIASADGVFPSIFADEEKYFTVGITDRNGTPLGGLRNLDDVRPNGVPYLPDGIELDAAIQRVRDEGDAQIDRVELAGDLQDGRIVGVGNTQWNRIVGAADEEVADINAAGDYQAERIEDLSDAAVAEITALLAGEFYATTAAGIAATTNGKFFIVAGPDRLLVYKNNAGVAALTVTLPNQADVQIIADAFDRTGTDPRFAGVLTTDDKQTSVVTVPHVGSGERAYVRGMPSLACLPHLTVFTYYGQSNAGGAQAWMVTPLDLDFGDFTLGNHTQTWSRGALNMTTPENRSQGDFALTRLQERHDGLWRMEFGSFGFSAGLKLSTAGGSFLTGSQKGVGPHFAFHNPSTGAIGLDKLLPGAGTGHYETLIDDVRRAKIEAQRNGFESFGYGALLFDQGEEQARDGGGVLITPWRASVDAWKAMLLSLSTSLNEDVPLIDGRMSAVPIIMRQTPIARASAVAQRELANEHSHLFLSGPRYQFPSAVNSEFWYVPADVPLGEWQRGDAIHMSGDGQRNSREIDGLCARAILTERKDWRPLQPLSARRINGTTVRIAFDVPSPPLKLSDVSQVFVKDYGFAVFLGDWDAPDVGATRQTIASVSVVSATELEITLSASIGSADAFVRYGFEDMVDTLTPVETVQAGANYVLPDSLGTLASTEIVFDGDHLARVNALLKYGKINAGSLTGAIWIKDARVAGGKTILRGWTKNYTGTISAGQFLDLKRDFPGGNLCDSYNLRSPFKFTDPNYGTRQAEHYPLNNHCICFWENIA